MSKLSEGIQVIIFEEHPIVRNGKEPDLFELGWTPQKGRLNFWKDEKFDHRLYCICLIEKVIELRSSFLDAFLDFQLKKMEKPFIWLQNLETLLNANVDLLLDMGVAKSIHILLGLVERWKKQLVSEDEEENPSISNNSIAKFDIQQVKEHCKGLVTYREIEAYLLRKKFDYLQTYGAEAKSEGVSFLQQVELELEYLEELRRLQPEESVGESVPLIWNDKANQLADIFYQCMHTYIVEEQGIEVPLIANSRKEVVDFIVTHFRKADGKRFNPSTIRSYLMPSRIDKRPKEGRRVKVKRLLDDIESSGEEST